MYTPYVLDLTMKDWRIDGYVIKGDFIEIWADLDWSKAYVDAGPSPAGNLGPYWHVPRKNADTIHRLYPKIPAKWRPVVYRALKELQEQEARKHAPQTEAS